MIKGTFFSSHVHRETLRPWIVFCISFILSFYAKNRFLCVFMLLNDKFPKTKTFLVKSLMCHGKNFLESWSINQEDKNRSVRKGLDAISI
ncbi:hypothetical protein C815_01517 [Firmicutes bacterium M10-2]|nr:hypothetical protein C815_01517 [Firmicutes bacterium M10-2]